MSKRYFVCVFSFASLDARERKVHETNRETSRQNQDFFFEQKSEEKTNNKNGTFSATFQNTICQMNQNMLLEE